jgi:hypothetical protein
LIVTLSQNAIPARSFDVARDQWFPVDLKAERLIELDGLTQAGPSSGELFDPALCFEFLVSSRSIHRDRLKEID